MKSYSQRDEKWAKKLLGNSNKSTIGNYGCKLTCFSILDEDRDPEEMNKIFKKGNCFFGKSGDLLEDNACAKALGWEFVGIQSKDADKPKEICIAEVDMSPAPGKQQHFVVYDPRGRIYDPWTGTRRSVKTYPIINYRLFNVKKMSKITISKKLLKAIEKASGIELGDKINEEKEEPRLIEWLESFQLIGNTVKKKNEEVEALKKERSALQSKIATCQVSVVDAIRNYLKKWGK